MDDFHSEAAPIFFLTDNAEEIETVRAARCWAGLHNRIRFFKSADMAATMLQSAMLSSQSGEDIPLMIVIRRQVGVYFGFDLLNWLRCSPAFEGIPVVVLSDACTEYEAKRCLELGANAYAEAPKQMESWIRFFSDVKAAFESAENRILALDN